MNKYIKVWNESFNKRHWKYFLFKEGLPISLKVFIKKAYIANLMVWTPKGIDKKKKNENNNCEYLNKQ